MTDKYYIPKCFVKLPQKMFFNSKKQKIVFRGPIKYFESAPRELGRFRDGK